MPGKFSKTARRYEHLLFLCLVVYMTLITVFGFGSAYLKVINTSAIPQALRVVFLSHIALFSFWLILTIYQTSLIGLNKRLLHKRIGIAAILVAFLIAVSGLWITFAVASFHRADGSWDDLRVYGFIFEAGGDILLFVTAFSAGLIYRGKKDTHKRLMILAIATLMYPAVARIVNVGSLSGYIIYLTPLIVICLYDFISGKKTWLVNSVCVASLTISFLKHRIGLSHYWTPWGKLIFGDLGA